MNEYCPVAQRLFKQMPSVVQDLADTGAIKKARKTLRYDDVQVWAFEHGWTWSDILMSPWHGVEWCLFKAMAFIRPQVWEKKDRADWNSAGNLTTYAQAGGFSLLTLGYGFGLIGHEKGVWSGLSQAFFAVVGFPIRVIYWPVCKMMGIKKADRLEVIEMKNEGSAVMGEVIRIESKHKDKCGVTDERTANYLMYSDFSEDMVAKDSGYKFAWEKINKTIKFPGAEPKNEFYVYRSWSHTHDEKGIIQRLKGLEKDLVSSWNPIRLWDALVGNKPKFEKMSLPKAPSSSI